MKVRLGRHPEATINETLYKVKEPGGPGQEQLLHLVRTDSFPKPGNLNCAPQNLLESPAPLRSGGGRRPLQRWSLALGGKMSTSHSRREDWEMTTLSRMDYLKL